MTRVIYCNTTKCDNCGNCITACQKEHHGRSQMFIQPVGDYFIPANCRQCDRSPCVEVCPTGACARVSPEAVSISSMKCVGCRLCILACPFGAIWFDALDKISRKCDQCRDRLAAGFEPACVKACNPQHALIYGQLEDLLNGARIEGLDTVISRASGQSGMVMSLPASRNGKGA